jgi:hypothetical protein
MPQPNATSAPLIPSNLPPDVLAVVERIQAKIEQAKLDKAKLAARVFAEVERG